MQFAPFMIIATFLHFDRYLMKNSLYKIYDWKLADNVPDEIKEYFKDYLSYLQLIIQLKNNDELKVCVGSNMQKLINYISKSGSELEIDTETLKKIDSPNNIGAFVSLKILVEFWSDDIDMRPMYMDGLKILTLSAENRFVTMGDDQFGNIYVKYFVPNTNYSVIITNLNNSEEEIDWLTLLDAYRTLDLTENPKYKGVRFLPVSSDITNIAMKYIIDSHNDDCNCIATQCNGRIAITSKTMLSLSMDSLTIGNLRGGDEKRKNIKEFIIFYNKDMKFIYFINVYKDGKILYSTIQTRANYNPE